MRLITFKDKEITSYEHSQIKKRALEEAIAQTQEKQAQLNGASFNTQQTQESTLNQNDFDYKNELFYLIQSPEKVQFLDEKFKRDVEFITQAISFNPIVINYLDDFMLNNKQLFLNLLQNKNNSYVITSIGQKLQSDGNFLLQAIQINPNCSQYFTNIMQMAYKAELAKQKSSVLAR